MRGYKVFNPDWTCRDMQYEVGKSYEMTDEPVICERGFHFCEKLIDCFNYYEFDSNNKVAEIEAYGDLDFEEGCNKCCTNKIKIIHELNWHEVLDLVNTGKDCTGSHNCGDYNSGDSNSGDYNRGCWNSGNYNNGDWNNGDWNSASNCTGCFNTISQSLMFFDKPSNLTFKQWRESEAYCLMDELAFRPTEWIPLEKMTDIEKENHPYYETTGGYLKNIDNSGYEWREGLTKEEKKIIKGIPNFDSEKFYQITGIKVE